MAAAIRSQFPDANSIVGVATAGIALGALVADELGLPFAYCRPKPKEHGMKNQLEGRVDADAKVVVFEDLISTGGSSLKVVEYLRNDGIEVMGLAAVFTYGFPLAQKNFDDMACPFITLSDYSVLIEQAIRNGYVNQSSLDSLTSWRTNPDNWKPASE
jgi:orotate phosphoribosyltransferase